MGIFDGLKLRFKKWLLDSGDSDYDDRRAEYTKLRQYKIGSHPAQMKVRSGQADDNIVLNFISLIVDRSISFLFGSGIEFDLPGKIEMTSEEGKKVVQQPEQANALDAIWKANKKGILLHKLGYFGSLYGMVYVRLLPLGIANKDKPNERVTRLVALRPCWMTVDVDSEDMEKVTAYTIQFEYIDHDANGHPMTVQRKEIIERALAKEGETKADEYGNEQPIEPKESWLISNFIASKETAGKFVQMGESIVWPYEFPPILHWQNLPDPESVYGISDVQDVLGLQDRENFVLGNVSKIVRYFAHPMRWSRGVTSQTTIEVGADKMLNLSGDNATIAAVEMNSDLASSRNFALDLRQAMFDISRTIDVSSLADKLGALTNFGLRVLFMDALAKLGTKQELYGDALSELNHRLLVLAGFDGEAASGGEVIWPDPLPRDKDREALAHVQLIGAGVESVPTAQQELGLDPDTEKENMSSAATNEQNIGEMILQNFSKGR